MYGGRHKVIRTPAGRAQRKPGERQGLQDDRGEPEGIWLGPLDRRRQTQSNHWREQNRPCRCSCRRAARLAELDPVYVDVIITRWEQATGRKAELLEG
jgi:hypothetical protein